MEMALEKIKLKKTEDKPCQVTFSVQVPSEIIKSKEEEVERDFQKVAQLPGFRAGKAPMELIRNNFSTKIKSETLEQILRDAVPHILKEKAVHPISSPVIEQIQYDKENSLSFNMKIERSPEFSAKNYLKIPVEKKISKITEEDISKELEQLRERNSQLAPSKSEKVEKNHLAVIDYAGYDNGQANPELKAENQMIDLAVPQSIAGFAEGVLGLARGETKEISVPFPKEHPQKNLAGKTILFKVTVREIKEKVVPQLDDEFAKDLGLASLEELKSKVSESLRQFAERNTRKEVEKQLFDHIIKENLLPVPESLVNMQIESSMEQAKEYFMRQGTNKEQWEQNREALREKYRPQAERQVQLSYLLHGIAKQENLQSAEDDLKIEMEKAQAARPEKSAEIKQYFLENRSTILNQMTEEKVINFLLDHAKVKEIAE